MAQPDVTASDVTSALDEFDAIGREEFLAKYSYGEARGYFVLRDGKEYDSKAIVGAAHALRHGEQLMASEFNGGEATVKRLLEELGFQMRVRRNPAWRRDEVILACELVHSNGWNYLSEEDRRVVDLSSLLQRLPLHPPEVRTATFRNPAGVARKTADIATQHPAYRGAPTKGGQHDREVLMEFLAQPDRMQALATQLRTNITTTSSAAALPEIDLGDEPASEGGLLERTHLARDRDPKAKRRKLAAVLKTGGTITCEACGFDFGRTYGKRGHEYIECHHRVPLHVSGPVTTRVADLALLCSNCHRMIHRGKPWLTVEELTHLVRQHAGA
ncbi:HNH endonuclease [Actinomycetospora callitridis]|uniref:HNH endonuclease n=1 Tax=Actinomycetospora callitridis TaxID=913944 RepID=UPI0023656A93|nr:HNH endonuclease [Actinomycetospora callitridis]MDD7920981.1 HNH endonuclease [Actinomycetospora callitridis]